MAATILLLVYKQWGASGYAVTFPIAFNVVYNVLSIPQTTASTSNAYWGRFYITALTKNGFNVSDTGAGSNRWIAIGSAQPQWGINSAGNDGSEGESGWYAFPVNFNSACFALFCGLRNTDTNNPTKYDSEVQPRNWTTSKFNVYKQDYGGDPWFSSFIQFAIGRQPASYKL